MTDSMTNASLLLADDIRGFQYVIRIYLSRHFDLWHSMDKIVLTSLSHILIQTLF